MKDLATQAYIAYLHKMVEAHEEIRAKQDEMIKLLEAQVKDLAIQLRIHQDSYENIKAIIQGAPSGTCDQAERSE